MSNISLQYVPDTALPFFYENSDDKVVDLPYKIYNDGGHYIATVCVPKTKLKNSIPKKLKTDYDMFFKAKYKECIENGLSKEDFYKAILDSFTEKYPNFYDVDSFIKKKLENEERNLYYRKKRLRRKANMNYWNYFCTFTYSDEKISEEEFKKKLRRCLSNLHTRHHWNIIGVWERGEENKRLHLHCLIYVPVGEMVGDIRKDEYYSTKKHRMETAFINDFFEKRFGRNDFKELNAMELKNGSAINYLLKYIGKTNERIIYSRGIKSEIYKRLNANDIATQYQDFVTKYVLFDDTISFETDVMGYVYRQSSFFNTGNRLFT